ncbi:pentapeptide repeat-containing protein [Lichenihabitans sp. Uapishka_5]|uniref:pentapeptide repeat-containing protein n=1 Tax=Lichenihabitans sp. Uapishka_5 TaxID=3037302 RepID=UPI0029E7DC4B|nr:pentapeptide repeat-containing protein [Lichenihabitans sp. Uapishka_5]MDX7952958.1 pentapeptide repeat-containing protein [Lichenihabitans sp. Uapishka_5]
MSADPTILADPPADPIVRLLATRGPHAAGEPQRLVLDQVLAGRQHLEGRDIPGWQDRETGGLDLKAAVLRSAGLNGADLSQANLRGADLEHAQARGAHFDGTILEQARFIDADCGGASFAAAQAGEACFERAMLEDARFDGASLRFADLRDTLLDGASFAKADLWGARFDACDADEASFAAARLDEASLKGGNFAQGDFRGASLKKARLEGARLRGADFADARLEGANLAGADLSQASLPRVNLTATDLTHVRLGGAWLENTRLRVEQLGGQVGEERDGEFAAARQAYVALEGNFRSLGDAVGESWAFRKSRRMGRAEKNRAARAAWAERQWRPALVAGFGWLSDSFVEWLCDYGESLWRVVRAFFTTVLGFALCYGLTGSLTRTAAAGAARAPTRHLLDLVVFSFINMLSTSAPDIGIRPANELVVLLVSLQGALGIVLIGLFGYVLGNRMHR